LIKTHEFLSHFYKARSKGNEPKSIEEFQMNRIRKSVEKVVRYLAKALLDSSKRMSMTCMLPDNHVRGESNYYYVMMTVWYTWKYFTDNPDRKWDCLSSLADQKKENSLLFDADRLPSDNWTFARGDRDKVQLLQWYHYGSLQKLCKHRVLPTSWQGDPDLLKQKVARLAIAAKVGASAKLSSQEPYVADDEIFDRLSFLSDELDLEDIKTKRAGRPGPIELLSMKRVKQRDSTRSLNPGWLPRGDEESTSGPWEIHALCHHSRLVVLIKEEESKQEWRTEGHAKAEEENFRQRICTFLNAEGTLVPCWERAHAKARMGWLRSEATAVVASTLLTILQKTVLADSSTPSVKRKLDDIPAASPTSVSHPTLAPDQKKLLTEVAKLSNTLQDHNDQARQDQKLFEEVSQLNGLMRDQLEAFERFSNESGLLPPIQWTSFRPTRKYHPVSFFNSLEDTPDLYKPEALAKVSVPFRLPHKFERISKGFHRRDVDKVVRTKCLSLFDIRATGPVEDAEGFTWQTKKWRYGYDDSNPSNEESFAKRFSWALYDNVSKPRTALSLIF
jgi:hypothetical protein